MFAAQAVCLEENPDTRAKANKAATQKQLAPMVNHAINSTPCAWSSEELVTLHLKVG
jgi:hypothetical protein